MDESQISQPRIQVKHDYIIFYHATDVYGEHIDEPPNFPDETPVFHTNDRQQDFPLESNTGSDIVEEPPVIRRIPIPYSDGTRQCKYIRVYVRERVQSRSGLRVERDRETPLCIGRSRLGETRR